MPFGYGPAAKLLMLAPLLRHHWQLVFVGHGIAWELVSRCPECFDRIIEADADCPKVQTLLHESAGLLSVMDRDFAKLAGRMHKPCYVVDSLLWMRDEIPPDLTGASIYWAQRFASMPAWAESYQPRPTLVGPIISIDKVPAVRDRSGLLINLGGAEAVGQRGEHYRAHAEFVLKAILESGLVNHFEQQVTVVGGSQSIASLRHDFGGWHLEFASLSPRETIARIRAAAVVLTTPGLTNTLECFRNRAKTFFLPPQNYSQWCVLNQLHQRQLAPSVLRWEDAFPDLNVQEGLSESARGPLVQMAISRMTTDDAVCRELAARLKRIPQLAIERLVSEHSRFLSSLGPNGTVTIAGHLRSIATGSIATTTMEGNSASPQSVSPKAVRSSPHVETIV